jgi:hypothetical protein
LENSLLKFGRAVQFDSLQNILCKPALRQRLNRLGLCL